jgi:hypothetical protein
MQLSSHVSTFTRTCERLLAAGAVYRPLTNDEVRLIEFYCKELLQKVVRSPE